MTDIISEFFRWSYGVYPMANGFPLWLLTLLFLIGFAAFGTVMVIAVVATKVADLWRRVIKRGDDHA